LTSDCWTNEATLLYALGRSKVPRSVLCLGTIEV
jgi:hypothetical protein